MTATTAPASFIDRAPVELPQPIRLRILLAVMIGVFLAALDQTVVGTALPRIVTDLHGNDVYTWAFTAYLLTATISGPHLRQALRPVRSATHLPARHRHLPGRLGPGRRLAVDRVAHRLARHPGPRRRSPVPDRASPSSATSSRPRSGASTRASSEPSSASPSSSGRPSAGSSPTRSAGTGSSSSTCRSVPWPPSWCGATCRPITWAATDPRIDYVGAALFTAALVPILRRPHQQGQTADWTDLSAWAA